MGPDYDTKEIYHDRQLFITKYGWFSHVFETYLRIHRAHTSWAQFDRTQLAVREGSWPPFSRRCGGSLRTVKKIKSMHFLRPLTQMASMASCMNVVSPVCLPWRYMGLYYNDDMMLMQTFQSMGMQFSFQSCASIGWNICNNVRW